MGQTGWTGWIGWTDRTDGTDGTYSSWIAKINCCIFCCFVDKPGDFSYYYDMKKMKKSWPVLMFLFMLVALNSLCLAQNGFSQKDRELLIQLNTRVNEMEKRFEQRFEQVDKRFAELREDVNKRFEEMREDMNKRFEQVDNRFGEMMTYIGILAAIFAAITVGTFSFALWDRRTMVRPFESKVKELDEKITVNKNNYEKLMAALKEYADKNKKFADSVQQFNLF